MGLSELTVPLHIHVRLAYTGIWIHQFSPICRPLTIQYSVLDNNPPAKYQHSQSRRTPWADMQKLARGWFLDSMLTILRPLSYTPSGLYIHINRVDGEGVIRPGRTCIFPISCCVSVFCIGGWL